MPKKEHIQAICRAVDILELVASSPDGLRLCRIARACELPRQTAYSILETLVHKRLLVKDLSSHHYRLEPAIVGLRARQEKLNPGMLRRAMPVVLRLATETGAEVVLSEYIGGRALGRIRIPTIPDANPITVYAWGMLPYGTGLVFQAYMSPAQLTDFRRENPLGICDPDDFWKSYQLIDELIALLRRAGSLAYIKDSKLRVIVPVVGAGGTLAAALSLFKTPITDISSCGATRSIALAVGAAAELSTSLQGRPVA